MYIYISYNTGKIYVHNTLGHAAPEGKYVYIRKSTSACVITITLHFWYLVTVWSKCKC